MPPKVDPARIVNFYHGLEPAQKKKRPSLEGFTIANAAKGIGDAVILTALPRAAYHCAKSASIYSLGPHLATLLRFNPYCDGRNLVLRAFIVEVNRLLHEFDLGNGHFIQRLERAIELPPEGTPRGCLQPAGVVKQPGRVVLHFEPGSMVHTQRRLVHPRAREVYPESLTAIRQYIERHPEMSFAEVGSTFSGLAGVENWTNLALSETIEKMATGEYFLGINSGPMHLAAALDMRMVVIVNFPPASSLYLPVLKDVALEDVHWLYPQSVVLHQDGEGELVKRFCLRNLERAFQGELYPYWSTEYLDLIYQS